MTHAHQRVVLRIIIPSILILALCISAALLYMHLRRPRLVHAGSNRLAFVDETAASNNQIGRPSVRSGCIANWNGRFVYITSEGSYVLVRSVIDKQIVETIPADIQWPAPSIQVIADGPKLYLLFYDGKKGPCLALCENGREPLVTALLPANTLMWPGKWISEPEWDSTLTWRSSDFQLQEDGSLEGLVGIYRRKKGEYYTDPEEEITADFWFRYIDGKVKYSKVGEHMGAMDFRLVPSGPGYPSGLLSGYGDRLYYREVRLNKDGKPVIGEEKMADLHIPTSGRVRGFELIPPAADDAGELKVLLRTYSDLGFDYETANTIWGDYAWKLVSIDRKSFSVKSNKPLFGFGDFDEISDDYSNIMKRYGNWVVIVGYKEDYSKPSLLAFDINRLKGYMLRIENKNSLMDLGLFQYSDSQVGIGYMQWDDKKTLPKNILDIYKLILPK